MCLAKGDLLFSGLCRAETTAIAGTFAKHVIMFCMYVTNGQIHVYWFNGTAEGVLNEEDLTFSYLCLERTSGLLL